MAEHYPKKMVGEKVPAYCTRCKRVTDHVIVSHTEHSGRMGHCVDPKHPPLRKYSREQERRMKKAEREARNPRLF